MTDMISPASNALVSAVDADMEGKTDGEWEEVKVELLRSLTARIRADKSTIDMLRATIYELKSKGIKEAAK